VEVRSKPPPPEFPGVHCYDDQEIQGALRILRSKSLPPRYFPNWVA